MNTYIVRKLTSEVFLIQKHLNSNKVTISVEGV